MISDKSNNVILRGTPLISDIINKHTLSKDKHVSNRIELSHHKCNQNTTEILDVKKDRKND